MRVIVKNADFSSVSIGKVVEDKSFSFAITNENASDYLLNPPTVELTSSAIDASENNNNGTTIYAGSAGESTITVYDNNQYRWVSKFFEVIPGMVINFANWMFESSGSNSPLLICFNENKEIMNQPNGFWTNVSTSVYTIPEGCKYIKFQNDKLKLGSAVLASMPE